MTKLKAGISIKLAPLIGFTLIAILLGLTGCVGVPLPAESEKPRISEQKLEPFKPGVTTRKDIESTLGKPDLIRWDNNLWIYGWSQHHGEFAGLFYVIYGVMPFHRPLYYSHHALFAEFDEKGVLKEFEFKNGKRPCRDDGICVIGWKDKAHTNRDLYFGSKLRFDESVSIVTASEHDDLLTKNFIATDEVCGFYLFTSFKPLLPVNDKSEVWFSISELENQSLHYDTYAFLILTPGKKELLVQRKHLSTPNVRKSEPGVILKEFDCQAGKNIYLHIDLNEWAWKPELTVNIDAPSLGQERIKDKKLQLFATDWAEHRDSLAGYQLYYSGSSRFERLKGLCHSADSGYAFAQAEVGRLYRWGLMGAKQDSEKAYLWYSRANQQNPSMWQDELDEVQQDASGVATGGQGGQCERDLVLISSPN